MNSSTLRQIVWRACAATALIGIAVVLAYGLFGHTLIRAMYESDLPLVDQIMQNRAEIPLELYFSGLDVRVLTLGAYLAVTAVLGMLCAINPLGVLFSAVSLFAGTLTIFFVLDLFPALVKPLHFDMIPYYNYRLTYVPDPVLGFRERPYNEGQITNFRGFAYSPLYGIDVAPQTIRWRVDRAGFRNAAERASAEVVVIGSSFPEYGNDLEDTYPKRLEKKLVGMTVLNLAKAGYGPLEYLRVFEIEGVKKKPRYALFALDVGGDVDAHLTDWIEGRVDLGLAKRSIAFGAFFSRYKIAMTQAWRMLKSGCLTWLQLNFQRMLGTNLIHPDVAVLSLPNNVKRKMLFVDRHVPASADELLRTPEWRALESVLVDFKQVSEEHHVVPFLVYIPGPTEVYAQYSTQESGANWLRVRESQIETSGNNETAVRHLAAKVGINLISLLPAFNRVASEGQLLYYPLDSHWNSKGREIAAQVTAQALKAEMKAEKARKTKPASSKDEVAPKPQIVPCSAASAGKSMGDVRCVHDAASEPADGLMTRTVNGKILFWDRNAEKLYGWRKEEAIGKVSHKLLRTRFPESLQQIDAELAQNGKWEGKLVHSTRDGRRIVVESHWILKKESGAVIEINTPSATS